MLWTTHTDVKHSFKKILYNKIDFYLHDNYANKTSDTYVYDPIDHEISCKENPIPYDRIENEINYLANDDDLAVRIFMKVVDGD